MTTVAIQYGIFGGPLRAHRLISELRGQGYTVIKHSVDADIIIAHSAGCFWLPAASAKQKIMLIDPPYWPEKTITARGRARMKSNLQYKKHGYSLPYWLPHNFIGALYAVRRFRWHIKVARHAKQYDLPSVIKGRRLLLLRNEHDDWLTPDFVNLQKTYPSIHTLTLPGDHDDCLHNPRPYVALLKDLP